MYFLNFMIWIASCLFASASPFYLFIYFFYYFGQNPEIIKYSYLSVSPILCQTLGIKSFFYHIYFYNLSYIFWKNISIYTLKELENYIIDLRSSHTKLKNCNSILHTKSDKWQMIFLYHQYSDKYIQISIDFLDYRSINIHTVFVHSL